MPRQSPKSPHAPHRPGVHSLARALSKLGAASRTQAEFLITAGRVTVNGKRVNDPRLRVDMHKDQLCIDDQPVTVAERIYLMLNKPRGLVTTARDERGRDTVYQCLPEALRGWIAPVGRLDKASEGLLLFSNDTQWASLLLDPAHHLPRVYHVQIDGHPTPAQLQAMRDGIRLDDGHLAQASAVSELRRGDKQAWLAITLTEGRNRQIRRMLYALGFAVQRLVRVAIGPLSLGDLAKGATRTLTEAECTALSRPSRSVQA